MENRTLWQWLGDPSTDLFSFFNVMLPPGRVLGLVTALLVFFLLIRLVRASRIGWFADSALGNWVPILIFLGLAVTSFLITNVAVSRVWR
jgi:hypothetical protein